MNMRFPYANYARRPEFMSLSVASITTNPLERPTRATPRGLFGKGSITNHSKSIRSNRAIRRDASQSYWR